MTRTNGHPDTIELQRTVFAAMVQASPEMMQSATLDVVQHIITDQLLFQLRTTVWSRHLGDAVVRYPANWWQAFKKRFFPYWALRRWPVLETVVVIDAYHDYPGVRIQNTEPLLHYRYAADSSCP